MGSRKTTRWKPNVVLVMPLAAGTAAVAFAVAQAAPASAGSSPKPTPSASGGLLGLLPSLLPTSLPSLPLPTSLPTLPLPSLLPSLSLPTQSASPAPANSPTPAPAPAQSSSPQPSSGSSSASTPGRSERSPAKPSAATSQSAAVPVLMPWAASSPTTSLLPSNAIGYALPVPASLVAASPGLIGEGASVPRQARAAGPVTIGVPSGTEVDAVTAGVLKTVPAGRGVSTLVLSGQDGATYTYRNVIAGSPSRKVTAGTKIGTSGPGGLAFSIAVPDVRGLVDADEAMQAWASGLSTNVRSLPSSISSGVTAPARDQVLLVTSPSARATASTLASTALARSLTGPLVQVHDATLSGLLSPEGKVAKQVAASSGPKLVVAELPDGTPAQAAELAALLPVGHQLLWVAPPGTTSQEAAAYRAIVAAHPAFRVESLPAALSASKKTPAAALATATLTATYVSTAYRLQAASSEADAALNWAEEQLGKPSPGLTTDALDQAGIGLPDSANAQWQQTKAHLVPENRLAPGDLVFFDGSNSTGIYVGDGEIIDAPASGKAVRFDPLSGIRGYTGSTDPYTSTPASDSESGLGAWLVSPVAALAVPGALSQYQSFARQLTDSEWGADQFPYLYKLWEQESGWNPAALNPISGAFGIPQSLPATKMAAAGPDWASDPYTQIMWGISYISAAYGDPQAAWAHEVAYGWY